jgi:hypothetical protein
MAAAMAAMAAIARFCQNEQVEVELP